MIEEIKEYLIKNHISGNQFSQTIGMDKAQWSRIKSGKQGMTRDFLTKVGFHYPKLRPYVLDELVSNLYKEG